MAASYRSSALKGYQAINQDRNSEIPITQSLKAKRNMKACGRCAEMRVKCNMEPPHSVASCGRCSYDGVTVCPPHRPRKRRKGGSMVVEGTVPPWQGVRIDNPEPARPVLPPLLISNNGPFDLEPFIEPQGHPHSSTSNVSSVFSFANARSIEVPIDALNMFFGEDNVLHNITENQASPLRLFPGDAQGPSNIDIANVFAEWGRQIR